MIFDENKESTITCGYITVYSKDCLGKTLRQCNEAVYNCSLDFDKRNNEIIADTQAEEEYKEKIVNTICKS